MAYVYIHKTKDEGKPFYIGISEKKNGYNRAKNKRGRNPYWNRVVKKHGFTYEILNEGLSWEEAQEYEKKYIKEYKEKGYKLTNMTKGGEGTIGYKRPKEELRKIIDKQSKKKTLTVGGLIHKLKKYDENTPIYLGDVKHRDQIVWMDELTFIERDMKPHDIPHDWDDDGWGDDDKKCLVLFGASHHTFVKSKLELEIEFNKLNDMYDYYESLTEDEKHQINKRLDELFNKSIVFRYIDNIL